MLQLSQVNLLFVPCPFKSVKQNIHLATMSGPQHKLKITKSLEFCKFSISLSVNGFQM